MFNIQGRKWAKRGFLVLALAFLSAVVSFYTPIARAASNTLELSSVSVLSKSEGVEGDIVKNGETDIEHSITFHKVGDSVDFSVKMINKDDQKYVVESVAAENDNEFVVYEIGDYAGTIIQENGEFVFSVHEVYAAQLDDLAQRAQAASVKFTIKFGEKVEEINVNPKTSDDLWTMIMIAAISVTGLSVAIALIRKNKKAIGVIVTVAVVLIAVPMSVKAAADYVEINLVGEYFLNDRMIITVKNGEEEVQVPVDYGDSLPEIEEPVQEGYSFIGWTDEDGEDIDPESPIMGDIVIVPKFEANHYTLKFDGNGKTDGNMEDMDLVYDTETILPEVAFEKTGYRFVEWNTLANGEGDSYGDKGTVLNLVTSGETTLYAIWEANPYKIVYDGNGATSGEMETQDALYDREEALLKNEFKRVGYSFAGWNTDKDGNGDVYSDIATVKNLAPSGEAKLYAQWTPNNYTIEFNGNRSTAGEMPAQVMTYDKTEKLSKNLFERAGYNFVGWNTKAKGTGKSYANEEEVVNLLVEGSMTLYAQWEARTDTPYKVIHQQMNLNGQGYKTFETEYKTGTTGTKVTPEVKEYKGFKAPATQTKTISGSGKTSFTYKYERLKYSFALTDDETSGNAFGSVSFYYGTVINLDAIDRTGYTFIKWSNGLTAQHTSFELEEDTTVWPIYEANKYTIVFDGNKSTSGTMESQVHTYDQEQKLTKNAYKRAGYDFTGWNTDPKGEGDAYSDNQAVKNLLSEDGSSLTLYAQWEARNDTPYTVKYMLMTVDGNDYVEDVDARENLTGTTDTQVTGDVKTYYGFQKPEQQWKNLDGDGQTVIEYKYVREKFELKLIDEDHIDSEFQSGKYYYETKISLSAKKVLGYTFTGWTNGETSAEISFKLEKDTKIGPEYKPNKYTVEFYKNGATSGTMDNYYTYYDVEFKLPENKFKRVGYDFVGWNTKADGSGDSYKDVEKVKNLATEGTVTLYAQWKARNDTKYVVIHEKMNLDGETYTVFSSQKLKGTSDAFVTPSVTEIKGFIMPKPQTVKIEPDGSTVVTYQYVRMKMALTLTNEEFIESEFKTGDYFFETMITLTAKERKGYKFKKWSNGDSNTVISFKLTSNTKIGPEYLPNKYNIKFDKNGATSGTMETYYTYYDEHFTLPENQFKRQGYDFTGWNTQADGKGDHYNNIQKVSNLATEGTVVLYAQWKARTDTPYRVEHWKMNLDGKGYTLFETDELQGETDTEVEPKTKKYEGFKAPETQKVKILPDGSAKVIYEYERLKFTLTVTDPANVNEGLTSAKFYYGTVITLSGKKIKGYTLTHWTNGMEGEEISFELLGDLKIGPVYEANKYRIIFNANAIKDVTGEMEPQVHTYDKKLKLTKNAYKRAGYDFVGWSLTKNAIELDMKILGDEYEVLNMSTGDDVILYAQWKARKDTPYTVKHMLMTVDGKDYVEDKDATKTLTGTTDTLVTADVNTYEGFNSPKKQWKNLDGDGKMVIEYRYVRQKRLLTLNDEKYIVTEQPSGEYYYGTTINLKAGVVPGYTFLNWTDDDLTTTETISFALLKDTEIGPVYKANEYIVRFDGNGATNGASMDDIEMTYDADPVVLPENKFARMGYDYAGKWNTEANGSGTSYTEGASVKNVATSGTVILYAQWTPRNDTQYKVHHVVENMDGTFSTTTVPMTGTTDTYAEPAVNTYEHHDSPAVQKKLITGDGLMEITYTYPLTKIKLNLTNAQYITTTTPTGEYKYGTTITLTVKKRTDDYYFTNWTNSSTDEAISFDLAEETTIGPEFAYDSSFHTVYVKSGPCKFNGPNAPMEGEGCENGEESKGYIDTGIALFSETNLHKDFVVSFNVSGLENYSTTVNSNSEDYRATFFNSTLEVAPGYPGVVVRRKDGTTNMMVGSNVVKNGNKISNMKITFPMSGVTKITLIRRGDNFCYVINDGAPVYVNNFANHNAYFEQTAWFGASIENGVVYRNLRATMTNMEIKLGKDVHERYSCEKP